MSYQIDFSVATSGQIEAEICSRLAEIRLLNNITQAQLAEEAGVSLKTISRLEKGQGISLDTFIRVMNALKLHDHLVALLPNPTVRPMERIKFKGRERQRARPEKNKNENSTWIWKDSK